MLNCLNETNTAASNACCADSHVEALPKKKRNWDNFGIFASTLCMLHCLLTPLFIAALPVIGAKFLEDDLTHKILASFVFFFAIYAIGPGYFKHRRASILMVTVMGLSLVFYATFLVPQVLGKQWEILLISAGNILVVLQAGARVHQ